MTDSLNSRFIEIGRFGRPHGLNGNIRFMPNENFIESLFDQHRLVYIKNERADLIPARIEQVQVEKKRNQQTFFVKLDLIASRDDAETAMNKALFTTVDELDSFKSEEPSDTENLTGYRIISNDNEIGHVLDVFENPAHPILEIKYQTGSLLIPYVDEFIDRVDHNSSTIYCRNLDQLIDG